MKEDGWRAWTVGATRKVRERGETKELINTDLLNGMVASVFDPG